jgi:glycosyltransferase involved in cell wall biosynthesis
MDDSPRTNMRVLGASYGDPYDPRALSGAPKHLLDALETRVASLSRIDYSDHGLRRAAIGALTFRSDRDAWRTRYHGNRWGIALRTRSLMRRLKPLKFDIALQVYGLLAQWQRPAVLYLDQTSMMAQREWPAWLPGRDDRRRDSEQRFYNSLSHIFTMSERARDSLINDYSLSAQDVTTVGGGGHFRVPPPTDWRLPSDARILFVGRDWRRKGGDVLLEAFREVRNRLPKCEMVVVGTRNVAVEEGVTVLGEVASRDELSKLYMRASLVCLPSRYEPYGFAAIEGMAHGVPCVVSTAIDDTIVDEHSGLRVPVGDASALAHALLRILTDPVEAHRMSVAGLNKVENELNWDAVAARVVSGLEAI